LDSGAVVLVAGFQGAAANGDVTTLGRGGSDATAIALALALGLKRCEIFTDVSGVFTADPRVVTNARRLEWLSHEEMLHLALGGAQVLQPRAVGLAAANGIDVHVRSSQSTEPGTWCLSAPRSEPGRATIVGVAHRSHEAVYTVAGMSPATVTDALARWGDYGGSIESAGDRVHFTAPATATAVVTARLGHG